MRVCLLNVWVWISFANMKSHEQHVDALEQKGTTTAAATAMATTTKTNNKTPKNTTTKFLDTIKRLTDSEKVQRINEAVNLLQQLKEIKTSADDDDKVCVNCVVVYFLFFKVGIFFSMLIFFKGRKRAIRSSIGEWFGCNKIGCTNRFLYDIGWPPVNHPRRWVSNNFGRICADGCQIGSDWFASKYEKCE